MRQSPSKPLVFLLASTFVACGPQGNETDPDPTLLNSPAPTSSVPSLSAGNPLDVPAPRNTSPASLTIHGTLSKEGEGNVTQGLGGAHLLEVAQTVEILGLTSTGSLVPVSQTLVAPNGKFEAVVPADASPTTVFVMRVRDVGGAIVGAGIVNGLPAFAKAFAIDATINTLTSVQTEVLLTMAKGGVPGFQNYVNIINTYVDSQLANSIATLGVFTTDLTNLIQTTSDATLAAADVLVATLRLAGIPVDISALANAQNSLVNAVNGTITGTSGNIIATSKTLVTAIQKAASKTVAPLDQVIFNAIVNGGGAFGALFKGGGGGAGTSAGKQALANVSTMQFAATKSALGLQGQIMQTLLADSLNQTGASPQAKAHLNDALETFRTQVQGAQNAQDLVKAREALKKAMVQKPNEGPKSLLGWLAGTPQFLNDLARDVESFLVAQGDALTAALPRGRFDPVRVAQALAAFDARTQDLHQRFAKSMAPKEAKALADALRLAEKCGAL